MEYDEIINLAHHQSTKRAHMSMQSRAAQFAPFAALKGYEQATDETARLTDIRAQLEENEIELLNLKLRYFIDNIPTHMTVSITHFVNDEYKNGGEYIITNGVIKKFDEINAKLILFDSSEIFINDIYDIKKADI